MSKFDEFGIIGLFAGAKQLIKEATEKEIQAYLDKKRYEHDIRVYGMEC